MSLHERLHRAHVARRDQWRAKAVTDDGIDLKRVPPPQQTVEQVVAIQDTTGPVVVEVKLTDVEQPVRLYQAPQYALRTILRIVGDKYQISTDILLSPNRTAPVVRARMVAIYLAREILRDRAGRVLSLPNLGRRFGGRDHTTILYSIRKIRSLRQTDRALNLELMELETLIRAELP